MKMNPAVHNDKSFWLATAGDYTQSEPLRHSDSVDIAIIGAGFTGLATAYQICKTDPSANVAVLEAECVAFGASGRTSGWLVPNPVLEPTFAKFIYGQQKLDELQEYTWQGMDFMKNLIVSENMQSDLEHPGVTYTALRGHEKKLDAYAKYWTDQPRSKDCIRMDRQQVSQALNSDAFAGGVYMPHNSQVNPVKHARELKRVAMAAGAKVYEQTPIIGADDKGDHFILKTPQGELHTRHIVIATNAFTHLLPPELGMDRMTVPTFIYQQITEPLSPKQWKDLGWVRHAQFYDKTTLNPPTCRTTVDGRLQFNLCDVQVGLNRNMNEAHRVGFHQYAEDFFQKMFPVFKELKITHRWHGACAIPWDVKPQVGVTKNGRISYAAGYGGAGVVMSHNYGRILADLALGRDTALTRQWFVADDRPNSTHSVKRFPKHLGLVTALKIYFDYERSRGLKMRRGLGLSS